MFILFILLLGLLLVGFPMFTYLEHERYNSRVPANTLYAPLYEPEHRA